MTKLSFRSRADLLIDGADLLTLLGPPPDYQRMLVAASTVVPGVVSEGLGLVVAVERNGCRDELPARDVSALPRRRVEARAA